MQTKERSEKVTAPSEEKSRRLWMAAGGLALVAALVVGGIIVISGSDDGDGAGTEGTTVDTTAVAAGPALTPLEVAEALDAAIVAGDWEAALALYAEDATYTQLDDGFGFDFIRHGKEVGGSPLRTDMPLSRIAPALGFGGLTTIYPGFDWDEDGSTTGLDHLAALTMADYAWGVTDFYSCAQTDETTVVCDLILEGHALVPDAPPPVTDTFTVVDGRITQQVYDTTVSRFEDPFGLRLGYLVYVEENRPELENTLFSLNRTGELRMTPDTVETHRELIAEWRASG